MLNAKTQTPACYRKRSRLYLPQARQYDEAEALFSDAIRIQESHFGPGYAQLVPLYAEDARLPYTNRHLAASKSVKLRAMRIWGRQALGKTTA